jgi:carboxymethylenebutenolidase
MKRLFTLTAVLSFVLAAHGAPLETVHFQSLDGKTMLVAYLFHPESGRGEKAPAIVMLHGRAGPYSSLAKGIYDANTLSKRHKEWGEFWAARGYFALLVDSFGPRGYRAGFGRGSYDERPAEVSEQTVRPLDAYAALKLLRGRHDVNPAAIGIQGWSNGAMTVLVTMGSHPPGLAEPSPSSGFRAALAEYPGCGMDAVKEDYHNYAPLLVMLGSADEEVSPERCQKWAAKANSFASTIQVILYEGAEHNFDDPSAKKQANPANHKATEEAIRRAEGFFSQHLQH